MRIPCVVVTVVLVNQTGCCVMAALTVLTLSPAGVPSALRFMPGLLDAVKSAVLREAAQLFDKLIFVAGKVSSHLDNLVLARVTQQPCRQPYVCSMAVVRMTSSLQPSC